ncbi:MAG: oxygenase MpaB family protein [Pseudomonadota bacterium]
MVMEGLSTTLRAKLESKLDNAAQAFLYEGRPDAPDFAQPPGEAALYAPDSVSWRIFKNPVSLFIGGVAAVILELAEPRVCAGVWNHSNFREDPVARLKRTGLAAMITVYGARSVSVPMIEMITRMHDRVTGITDRGLPYHANDPELLNWVQATAAFGFLEAYSAYVYPLSDAEHDRGLLEGQASASLYGAAIAPKSRGELASLFEAMTPQLEASPIIFEFLDIMRRARALPQPIWLTQRLFVRAAVEITPPAIRARLGLGRRYGLRPLEKLVLRRMGRRADRIKLLSGPAAQASLRLGLPADYVYRR